MSGETPAFVAFLAEIKVDLILAEVRILRRERQFELRHVADNSRPEGELKRLSIGDLRALCDFTIAGQFRPLKSAPNLSAGWVFFTEDTATLELALNQLYPNAVADWFAVRHGNPPLTNYRDFTARQTGMYRITAMLNDTQAATVIRSCCDRKFCLKQRLWSVEGQATDELSAKSLVPCLEPCAILLEFARKGMRIEQEEKVPLALAPSDAAAIRAALTIALQHPDTTVREADFNAAHNPRRLQLALEQLGSVGITLANASEAE